MVWPNAIARTVTAERSSQRPRNSRDNHETVLVGLYTLTIAVIPWIWGGRTDLGRVAYVACVGGIAVTWLLRQIHLNDFEYRVTGVELLLLVGLAILVLQTIPLPETWIAKLAPMQARWLPLWTDSAAESNPALGLPRWSTLSLTPHATRMGLIVYVAHGLLFLVTCQWLRDQARVELLLRIVAVAAGGMAVLGLIQYLSGTRYYAWIFEHPSRDASSAATGPFPNPNHFAHFLALGAGPLLWWLHRRFQAGNHIGPTGNRFVALDRARQGQFAVIGLGFVLGIWAVAGGLSGSRGGILAMGLGVIGSVGLSTWFGMLPRKSWWALGVIAAVTAAGLGIHGGDKLSSEMRTLASGELAQLDVGRGRERIWRANWEVIRRFPLLGTGLGSHAEVYPVYYAEPNRFECTHAESSYLQVVTETGALGFCLLMLGTTYVVFWVTRGIRSSDDHRTRQAGIAIATGLFVSMLHAVVDFPWHYTSCAAVAIVLAASARELVRLGESRSPWCATHRGDRVRLPLRWTLAAVTVVFAVAVAWGVPWAVASVHFERYLVLSRHAARDPLRASWRNRSKDLDRSMHERHQYQQLTRMSNALAVTLRWAPHHPRAHLRRAMVLLQLFELVQQRSANAMGLSQIRDAALASNFTSQEAQDAWLERALEDRGALPRAALQHVKQGLRNCPMQGRGYLYWSELAFLERVTPDPTQALLSQAAAIRNHDGMVLFALGREAGRRGDAAAALEFLRRAYVQDAELRETIMGAVAPSIPAEVFVQVFSPTEPDLRAILHYYLSLDRLDDARAIAGSLVRLLESRLTSESTEAASNICQELVRHYWLLENRKSAIASAQRAVKLTPHDFEARWMLGELLRAEGELDGAQKEFEWCLRRRPTDAGARQALEAISRRRQQELAHRTSTPHA